MEIRTIPLDRVLVGSRLREIDPDWVAVIAASMQERGQRTPIEVRAADADGMYRLIAGAHRIAAAGAIGATEISAIVEELTDLQAELAEIEENLIRHELTPLDRATFLARHQQIWQSLHPETKRGAKGGRGGKNLVAKIGQENFFARFDEAIAAKIQASPRDIRRAVMRGARIVEDVRTRISGHAIARKGTELDALARLLAAEQRQVVDRILAGEATTVMAAVRLVRNAPPPLLDADADMAARGEGWWRKASARVRRDFWIARVAAGDVPAWVREGRDKP